MRFASHGHTEIQIRVSVLDTQHPEEYDQHTISHQDINKW